MYLGQTHPPTTTDPDLRTSRCGMATAAVMLLFFALGAVLIYWAMAGGSHF